VQATTHRFDEDTHAGAVVTDDGRVHPFDAAAFDASGLRHVRLGQRLTVRLDPAGRRVVALSLGTIGALDRVDPSTDGPSPEA
jgi:hypothetical protein